jgi:hypothetical protein
VIHAVRVIVVSRDLLCSVDAYGVRSGGGARGRRKWSMCRRERAGSRGTPGACHSSPP